ncbi:MAG: TetR/AcrR family transcriptional regulator [Candidatus Binatia bacterium]
MRLSSQGKNAARARLGSTADSATQQNAKDVGMSRREVIEEHLLEVAAQRFANAGYRQTTLEDIARHAGVAKASMYRYFENKQELLAKIFIKVANTLASSLQPLLTEPLAPEEKLKRTLRELLRTIGENVAFYTVFYSEEADLPQRLHAEIADIRQRFFANMERIFAEGMEQGAFRQMDVKLTVYAITGMCVWLYKWYTPKEARLDDVMTAFLEFVERGCLAPRGVEEKDSLADRLRHMQDLIGGLVDQAERLERENTAA